MKDRAQLLDAAVWAAFGVVVLVAAWRIDRLENLHINPWSIPGLLPGMVGALIILFAVVLGLRRPPADEPDPVGTGADGPGAEALAAGEGEGTDASPEGVGGLLRAAAAAIPCVIFALLGPATGLPFAADAVLYIVAFIALFSWPRWRAEGRILRRLLETLLIAVVSAGVISWLFESVFLVRLP